MIARRAILRKLKMVMIRKREKIFKVVSEMCLFSEIRTDIKKIKINGKIINCFGKKSIIIITYGEENGNDTQVM